MGLGDKLQHAWNAFNTPELIRQPQDWATTVSYGASRPDRTRLNISNERSIVSSIYTRLAIDVSAVAIRHVRMDEDGRFSEEMKSSLNDCLKVEANIDQAARAFRQDIAMTLFDEGVLAIVPVDTSLNPNVSGGYDILSMRVGKVVKWMPRHVRVSIYNDQRGKREEVTLEKKYVAIVENPLYAVMNETNSTLQRLIRKLNLLDAVDEQSSSGKLDLIIQLPYVIKSDARRQQAENRRTDIEMQLKGSKYGIAYTDGTEKITQLNRPTENNLMKQIEYLVQMLYSQLGLTPEVMNGTADEKTMLNYMSRTIEPLLDAITESMRRSFLTKTARTQGQSILYFRDPFKLVPISNIAEIADKFTRNEIMSSNEIRQAIGYRPAKDPKADELRNSNMPQSELGTTPPVADNPEAAPTDGVDATTAFDNIDASLDDTFKELGVNEADYT